MTEEKTSEEAWRDVGRQFQALGEGIAEVFRTAWESEENRSRMMGMQDGLEAMIDKVSQAINDADATLEGQKFHAEAEKVAESVRAAGEQAWKEARPHVLDALTQINVELQKVVSHLKEESFTGAPPSDEAPDQSG